jgi:hypothetical protein
VVAGRVTAVPGLSAVVTRPTVPVQTRRDRDEVDETETETIG